MAKATKESSLQEKIDFLDLDLENIPEFLMQYQNLDYRITNAKEDREEVVFKHIPIDKIQILLTPNTRNEELRKKYADALPLHRYLEMDNQDEIEKSTAFLAMLNNLSIIEIAEIEQQQESLNLAIPFRIKYEKSYLWQIYYSQVADVYFMLVALNDMCYSHMFYLLKEQIKFYKSKKKSAPKIYVPITHLPYSREILSKSEIKDIENYLWIFTNDWANSYEVFDKKEKPTIQIIGEAKAYDEIKTEYKIKLTSRRRGLNIL